jgi:YVTN family beta-propeller protein
MSISKSVGALVLQGLLLTAGLLGLATSPASADSLTTTISGFGGPFDVAVNPAGKFAYVLNHSGTTVSVIDLSNNAVTATIPGFNAPAAISLNPAGTYAYVTDGNNTVTVIKLRNNKVTATIPVGLGPWGVAFNPAGTFAYVTNVGSDSVSVIALK